MKSRKALVVTASVYNRTELFTILRKLKAADISWDIVARRKVIRAERGSEDEFAVDYTLEGFDRTSLDQYCAVIYTSGQTAETRHMWFSPDIKEITKQAFERDIPVAAVCCAAPCVRYVAKDKRVTGFPLHEILTLFKQEGAQITGRSVEVDGNLVTAEAEIQVLDWMNAILAVVNGKQPDLPPNDAHKYFPFWTGIPDSSKGLLRRPIHAGFTGTTADELLPVIDKECEGERVLQPFTGSGKEISILAREGRLVTSFDTLFLSHTIVDGIFRGKTSEVLDEDPVDPYKGWAYRNQPMHMDEECAMFIDSVAQTGELYKLAALGMSIIRSTMRGRLDGWIASVQQLEDSYNSALARNREWLELPGQLEHHHQNVLEAEEILSQSWNTIVIDPPKVISQTDIYSDRYAVLDGCLSQRDVELPVWRSEGFLDRMRVLLEVPWKRCLFMYTTGVSPTLEEIEYLLHSIGKVVRRYQVLRSSRKDVLYVVEK